MTATLQTRRADSHAQAAATHFSSAFEACKTARESEAHWLRNLREESFARVLELGFPGARDEEWRFLDLRPLYELNAQPHASTRESRHDFAMLNGLLFDGFDGHRLVFVNGEYSPKLSHTEELPAGATLGSLREHLSRDSELVQENLARYADPYQDTGGTVFTRLNTAFFRDGFFLHLPNGCEIEKPIHVLFLTDARGETSHFSAPRVLALAGVGSRATIIEHHAGRGKYFSNGVTEIVVGANAQIEHTRIQMESDQAFSIGTLHVQQSRDCRFSSHAVDFGGRLARNNAIAVMGGQNIECTMNGLYVTRGEQVVDNHTVMDHAEPNCNSYEVYTGILNDKSRGVFNGKIFVRRDAQKTDAKQSNRNLLLSDDAQINTKPQLEIFADDVKCTHGATIGQLDEEALFYLRARGIPKDQARALLIHAFAREAMEGIGVESVLQYLEKQLYARLS